VHITSRAYSAPAARTATRRLASGLVLAMAVAVGPLVGPAAVAVAAVTGSVSGQILDGDTGVAGVTVKVEFTFFPGALATGTTDGDGAFHIDVAPGTYKVEFDFPGGLKQFYQSATTFANATEISVLADEDTTITDQVVPHGQLVGQITFATGAPAPGAFVGLTSTSGTPITDVLADRDGRYVFPFVAPGSYRLTVGAAPVSAPRQWVHGHKKGTDADNIAVPAGQVSTVDEQLLPLGIIRGTFTDENGPVGDVFIEAVSVNDSTQAVFANTRADGTYTIFAYPDSYQVRYQNSGHPDQWANEKESQWRSDDIALAANSDVVLDQQALPTGRISGHLTDSAGNPEAFAGVSIENRLLDRQFQATTDENGDWFATVWSGTYIVSFETETALQYAFGKISEETATPVTVATDGSTVVNESMLAPGSLNVTAVDADTGTALTSFCADAFGTTFLFTTCTDDGTIEFPEIGPGTYKAQIIDADHLNAESDAVQVTSGNTSSAVVRLHHGATITVDVTDAATGAPITSGVCVNGRPADHAADVGGFVGGCVDETGTAVITRVAPGNWVFTASVFDGVHGSQWVGPHGGVGSQVEARVVSVGYTDSVSLHVRLDGMGTISGRVTDKKTGAPVAGATVGVTANSAVTGSDGRYQLDGLGPYKWVLFTNHHDYAGVWSGGGNNRLVATPVKVRLGQSTPYNIALSAGTTLTVKANTVAGRPPGNAEVSAVDTNTFDEIARLDETTRTGVFALHVLGPQQVKVLVVAQFPGEGLFEPPVWYPDAPDYAHGRMVQVPSTGTKTIQVLIS
jgi:hypothetical protein